jgi:hypothetical protein
VRTFATAGGDGSTVARGGRAPIGTPPPDRMTLQQQQNRSLAAVELPRNSFLPLPPPQVGVIGANRAAIGANGAAFGVSRAAIGANGAAVGVSRAAIGANGAAMTEKEERLRMVWTALQVG